MLPMLCVSCQAKIPSHSGIFHGRDFLTPCPICGSEGKPAAIIHLSLPCSKEEAHPLLNQETKFLGQPITPHKIACGFGPRLPRHLTNWPKAATCFQCLKVYGQLNSSPESSESQT